MRAPLSSLSHTLTDSPLNCRNEQNTRHHLDTRSIIHNNAVFGEHNKDNKCVKGFYLNIKKKISGKNV